MDLDEAKRVIDRVLQLHKPEEYGVLAVCAHCRHEDGGRVVMPCRTAQVVKASKARP